MRYFKIAVSDDEIGQVLAESFFKVNPLFKETYEWHVFDSKELKNEIRLKELTEQEFKDGSIVITPFTGFKARSEDYEPLTEDGKIKAKKVEQFNTIW